MGSLERQKTAQPSQIRLTLTLWNENEREKLSIPKHPVKSKRQFSDIQTSRLVKTKIHENSDLNPEVMKPEENSDTK